ncbi:DUF3857 domain-containing protein [Lujinxingia vulgaris]|uniref:DUF3857 domain-containing protein n=1 Tax=Lujinxingia vulgaris TaxID=2600176 RepID=A0A5C6X8W2_9DELT|nr:DUF3857 domain-containing protein [Lujinxingia vulgaris]TXD35601.1 DUF3857 domain-containing protein [Lujinxingia vulgaris]
MSATVWAQATATEGGAQELARRVDALEATRFEGEALGLAYQLDEERGMVAPEVYETELERAARAASRWPVVAFAVERELARARLERGDARGETLASEAGCLTRWSVVGPLENPSMQGFYEEVGPQVELEGPYAGRFGEVAWRELAPADYFCAFSLGSFVTPSTSAVVFLSSRVQLDEALRGELVVGAAGAYRVWIDGREVGGDDGERGAGLDVQSWPVRLSAGEHEVVVKLGSTGQGSLAWSARLLDGQGTPVAGVEHRAEAPQVAPGAMSKTAPQARAGALVAVRETTASRRASPLARIRAAAAWQRLQPADSASPWRDVARSVIAELERGTLSAVQQAEVLLEASPLFEERWRQVSLLERARELTASGEALWERVSLALAAAYGEGSARAEWQRQRAILEEVVEARPGSLKALLALAELYEARGLKGQALRLLEGWEGPQEGDREEVVAWVRAMIDAQEAAGDRRAARALRETVLKHTQFSGAYRWEMMKEAMAEGELSEALAIARERWAKNPWSSAWGLQVARALQVSGEPGEAEGVIETLIARDPGDASLWERKAELRLLQEDRAGVVEAMEQALSLRPQDSALRARAELMRPPGANFYDAWIEEDVRALAEAHPPGPHDYDILIDQAVVEVGPTGLARRFVQRVERVIDARGIQSARQLGVSFQSGDERVEVVGVRVHKADGTLSEDYDEWRSGQARKQSTTYNDREQINLRASNVEVGDLVEYRYVVHQVANENFRGDYFGAVRYVQHGRPAALVRYALLYPESWELYFRPPALAHEVRDGVTPAGEAVEGMKVRSFELREVPRVYTEQDQPGYTEIYDYIMVSNKADYDAIGRWWWELIEEQLVVDDAIREEVGRLTSGLGTDEAKVEAIFDYVARNTRYLHVGLGIHGWKPYRTSAVMQNRYGDCKDKAALLKVMLEEAGVDAEMVLVRTRRLGEVDGSVASMHVFNHAVTYVPGLDVFLDATAEYNGAFELTSMDQGAQALIVEDGGQTRWVTMPIDAPEQNHLAQRLEIDLRGERPVLRGEVEAVGSRAVRYRQLLEDAQRRDEAFERELARRYPGATLTRADYEGIETLGAPAKVRFEAELGDVVRGDGEGYLYPLAAPEDALGAYAAESTRRQDRMFRVPFAESTQVRYVLGPGRAVERVPEDVEVRSKFGDMQVSYSSAGDDLVVEVDFSVKVQRVPVEEYEAFRAFVSELHTALNQTIRLVGEGGVR